MIYEYKNKLYMKPLVNKIIEVKLHKNGSNYDIESVGKLQEIEEKDLNKMKQISIEEAYKLYSKKSSNSL